MVIFVDGAQKLPRNQLELVRTLLNFKTSTHKLIQIVLVAQLELRGVRLDESMAILGMTRLRGARRRLQAPDTPSRTDDYLPAVERDHHTARGTILKSGYRSNMRRLCVLGLNKWA